MRDVAASAEVALGTIYRYFPSKDALLAAAMVEWMEDLERRVTTKAPRGDTTVRARLRRAPPRRRHDGAAAQAGRGGDHRAHLRRPRGRRRVDRHHRRDAAGACCSAFPEDTDPETEAAIAKVLGHVWFSCLVAWSNGVGDLTWVGEELETATHLLCDHLG